MSIKLSLKELKDLLKIQNKKLKKRRKNKKKVKPGYENNIRSSSAHMISGGTTMMNTANEQGELIRLQRQALEDKLKEDKANNIKKEAKEKEAKEQHDENVKRGLVPYDRVSGGGGSNNLRNKDGYRTISNKHYYNIIQYAPDKYLQQMMNLYFQIKKIAQQ